MLNTLFRIVLMGRKIYWFIFRPVTIGVKVLVVSQNKILLIKNRYDKFWYLPGGGIKTGEIFFEAARREVKEECGINLEKFKIFGVYSNFFEYKSDHIILLQCDASESTLIKSGFEIEEAAFFNFNNLPDKISPATKRRIDEFISGKSNMSDIW